MRKLKNLQGWRDYKCETGARKRLARVEQRQHAPIGATVGLKIVPVEFLSKKLKISYSRNRPMQAKQSKKQKHTKNPTQKVHQASKSKIQMARQDKDSKSFSL